MTRPSSAALAALVLLAVASPGLASSPSSDYCTDSSCPYRDVKVAVHVRYDNPVGPDGEGTGSCQPIEGTGERPALKVYPILNMVVINQCFLGTLPDLLDGPVVLAGGLGHGEEMPDTLTITRETDGATWTATAVECAPPAGAVDPPRVIAYPVLRMYDLEACRLVMGKTWDAFTVVLQASP